MAKTVHIQKFAGNFAEDKDAAREVRLKYIVPMLDKGHEVILDFGGVTGATQSFVHALVSDLIRQYGSEVLERISFKDCNQTVKKIINIVVDYMQEG